MTLPEVSDAAQLKLQRDSEVFLGEKLLVTPMLAVRSSVWTKKSMLCLTLAQNSTLRLGVAPRETRWSPKMP